MIRALIADDHALVREGLKRILADAPEVQVVAECGDGRQVLALVREQALDIVLLDIALPGQNGLEVLKHIKTVKPELPVLILSMFPEEQYALRMMKAGAKGYLTKEGAPEQLVKAVRDVAGGKTYLSASLVERLVGEIKHDRPELAHQLLSDREFNIFVMIAGGKRLTQIAQELNLSIKTVSTHRSRILKKMQLTNNIELSHYAHQHGLLG
jgi:DNA-binding NarL/FixJ family response regulator